MAEITQKRKVIMRSKVLVPGGEQEHEAVDYVPVEDLEGYVADARTRWQLVEVPEPDVHDAGPAGDGGETLFGAHLIVKE